MSAFVHLLGQTFARRVLDAALDSERVASAYLFEGPPGCGKKTAARDLAAALVAPGDPDSRRRVEEGLHPDVRTFAPAATAFKVEQVRDLLKETALKPVEGARRVFILDQAETLNDASSNTLLKSIEEPPAGLHWVLVTTQRASILPTIASRCQSVRFHPLGQADLRTVLERKLKVGAERAQDLAALSNGSVKLAAWFETDDGKALVGQAESFMEAVASGSLVARLDWAMAAEKDRGRSLDRLLNVLALLLRERWARAKGLPKELYLLSQEPVHGRSLPPALLEQIMQSVAECRAALARNANKGLALDDLCLAAQKAAV